MPAAPLVVLGAPGSGAGEVASALALGTGLAAAIGDASGTDDRGLALRSLLRQALAAADADWTCPPAELPLGPAVAGELASLLTETEAVVHDVALVHALPGLARDVAEIRPVVLAGDLEETVRRLVDRTGLRAGDADAVVRTHLHRLATVVRRSGAVVIRTAGRTPAEVAADVAARAGLDFDAREAEAVPRPVAIEVTGHQHDDSLEELRRAAVRGGGITTAAPAALDGPWGTEPLDPVAGPRAATRRQLLRVHVAGDAPKATLEITAGAGSGRWQGAVDDGVEVAPGTTPAEVSAALAGRGGSLLDAVLLPDLLVWATEEQVRAVLAEAVPSVRDGGVVALCDAPSLRAARARRGLAPLPVEHVADLVTRQRLVARAPEQQGPVTMLAMVVRSETASRMRQLLTERDELETQVERWRTRAAEAEERVAALRERLVTTRLRLANQTEELEEAPSAARPAAPAEPATDDAQVQALRRDLAALQRRHDRLRGRRSVRLVLRLASAASPLIRLVRRFRGG